jgi:hypothetical protein
MSPIEPSVNAGQKTGISFCGKLRRERREGCVLYFVCPVVYGLFVVDLLAKATDERARRPYATTGLLLFKHRVQYRRQPVLEFAVVVVRHDEVADTIHAPSAQVRAVEGKVGEIGFAKALDKVLLDAAGGGDDARDVLVLHEVQDDFAEARGYEIGGVAEKDVAARSGAKFGVGTFLRFVVRDWFIGEAPATLKVRG